MAESGEAARASRPARETLWTAQTISVFGDYFTALALPLIAAITLKATPGQMDILTALERLPFLVLGLMAGVWVDRTRRRPILIAGDIGRGLVSLSIPMAATLGALGMPQLITAPLAIILDAISFFFSAGFLGTIRLREDPPAPAERKPILSEVREGLGVVLASPYLRSIAPWPVGCRAVRPRLTVGLAGGTHPGQHRRHLTHYSWLPRVRRAAQGAVAVAFMGLTIVAGQYALRRLEYRTRVEGSLAQH